MVRSYECSLAHDPDTSMRVSANTRLVAIRRFMNRLREGMPEGVNDGDYIDVNVTVAGDDKRPRPILYRVHLVTQYRVQKLR